MTLITHQHRNDQNISRSVAGETEEREEGPVVEEEAGIISESVSASSVIEMFGGVGRFKKTNNTGNIASSPSSGQSYFYS